MRIIEHSMSENGRHTSAERTSESMGFLLLEIDGSGYICSPTGPGGNGGVIG